MPAEVSLYTALHTVGDLVGAQSAVLVGHDWGADVVQKAMVMSRPFPRRQFEHFVPRRDQHLERPPRDWAITMPSA